jgi:hypothetical protein
MKSQQIYMIGPPLNSHCEGLQIILWTGRPLVGPSVGAFGEYQVGLPVVE